MWIWTKISKFCQRISQNSVAQMCFPSGFVIFKCFRRSGFLRFRQKCIRATYDVPKGESRKTSFFATRNDSFCEVQWLSGGPRILWWVRTVHTTQRRPLRAKWSTFGELSWSCEVRSRLRLTVSFKRCGTHAPDPKAGACISQVFAESAIICDENGARSAPRRSRIVFNQCVWLV